MRRKRRLWLKRLVAQLRVTKISPHLFPKMIADMQFSTMIMWLLRTARKARSSLLSPSISRIRAKMVYATSKQRFRRELEGVHFEIQATDPTEMDLEVIKDRAN